VNYYNEHDPKAAAWLRELITGGHIASGVVDERNIEDIAPFELEGFTQCHFFAGIGGWSLALRLSGWPDDKPVWTGSCPCQPFSVAGKGAGTADERHLWPAFKWLIQQCGPSIVFGEQVASKDGREWLAGVRADLEDLGFAVGAADLCAAGVGAPHIRQRLYWTAHMQSSKRAGNSAVTSGQQSGITNGGRMVQSYGTGRESGRIAASPAGHGNTAKPASDNGGMGNSDRTRLSEQCGAITIQPQQPPAELRSDARNSAGGWDNFDLIPCRDGKSRRIEAGTFPLAHGVPGRVGLLRGYGNAIVPQVAAEFIQASIEAIEETNLCLIYH
jgi:DNA (cytosine-5)-methyltransferase 1